MITFYYDETKEAPMYEQLYHYLKQAIEKNELKANEKLPSKRKLANHLKISQTTIETAYTQLLAEGYIQSVPRVGYFVLDHLNFPKRVRDKPSIKRKRSKSYQYDFKTNHVDDEHFPYQKLAKIQRDVALDKLPSMINQLDHFGLYSLRERIADILFAYRGIEALPEQIVVGSGSEHMISLLVLLLGRQRRILTEEPSYVKNYALYEQYGANVDVCPLDEHGISMDDVKALSGEVIHITPSHQYPTGIITPISRRIELLKWANESDKRYIVEDDYDSEFRFSGNPIPALKVLDEYDKVIYMNSFSKSLSPGFRVSFMVLPRHLLERYHELFSYFSCSVPIMTQLVLQRFIETNEFEKHLNRMKNIYKHKRDALIHLLEETFGEKIEIKGDDAGLHFLVECRSDVTETDLIQRAKEKNIRVYGLGEYYVKKIDRHRHPTLVFGYSHFRQEDLIKAVQLLDDAWKDIW